MAFEEIERLKEKLDKDPDSKLFILLAEEYKKAGLFGEAIDVLNQGLDKHPRYMSARVSLGKIYLEKGMVENAKAEFEEVVRVIPDNLYAHKKLAEIHRDLVEMNQAIKEYKTVLRLNPDDEEAANSLAEIEKGLKAQPEVVEAAKAQEAPSIEPEPLTEEEEPFDIPFKEEDREDVIKVLIEPEEEKVEEVTELEELSEEEIFLAEDILKEPELTVEGKPEVPVEEEQPLDIPVAEEGMVDSIKVLFEEDEEKIEEVIAEQEELTGEEALLSEDIFKESEVVIEESGDALEEEIVTEQPGLSISNADMYISQGRYLDAMSVYRELLSTEPENRHVLQRVEELKTLLKLLGKDKEELITKLNRLLDGIKKRRDEFFGNS